MFVCREGIVPWGRTIYLVLLCENTSARPPQRLGKIFTIFSDGVNFGEYLEYRANIGTHFTESSSRAAASYRLSSSSLIIFSYHCNVLGLIVFSHHRVSSYFRTNCNVSGLIVFSQHIGSHHIFSLSVIHHIKSYLLTITSDYFWWCITHISLISLISSMHFVNCYPMISYLDQLKF